MTEPKTRCTTCDGRVETHPVADNVGHEYVETSCRNCGRTREGAHLAPKGAPAPKGEPEVRVYDHWRDYEFNIYMHKTFITNKLDEDVDIYPIMVRISPFRERGGNQVKRRWAVLSVDDTSLEVLQDRPPGLTRAVLFGFLEELRIGGIPIDQMGSFTLFDKKHWQRWVTEWEARDA